MPTDKKSYSGSKPNTVFTEVPNKNNNPAPRQGSLPSPLDKTKFSK